MIDIEIINNILEQMDSTQKLIISLLILLSADILLLIIRLIFDFRLKKMDKKIHALKLKEEKRIQIYEELYSKLNSLTYIEYNNSNTNLYLIELRVIEKFIADNTLYISKEIESASYNICDYFKSISTDNRKKDFKEELRLLKIYKTEFNR